MIAKSASPRYQAASSSSLLAQIAFVGFHGVDLFFVISGFILALPFAAHYIQGKPAVGLAKYYLRRLTRLEPPYFLAVILLFFLAWIVKRQSPAALFPHALASLFYLHDIVYGVPSAVIGVAWSLEIEVQFYLLVPLLTCLFLIRSARARSVVLVSAVILCLGIQLLIPPSNLRIALSILGYLQFFLIGFFLADIYISRWNQSPQQSVAWDIVSLSAWPAMIWFLHSRVLTHWLFPFTILLVYMAAFRGRISSSILRNRFVTVVGGMCYSIYLLHYEVISAVGRFTKNVAVGMPYSFYFLIQSLLIAIPILTVCGVYFFLIERPCMNREWPKRLLRLIRQWIPSERLPQPAAE